MTETVVLTRVAVMLSVLSVLLLGPSVLALYHSVALGRVRDSAIEILDSVLLVMMIMEIV